MIKKIISGGQTGVDQAALDAAIFYGISYGGRCPKGRINEYGTIPSIYAQLKEIDGNFKDEKANYDARTVKNIEESDGTLIFVPKIPLPSTIKDGTLLTIEEVKRQKKPYLLIDLSQPSQKNEKSIINWINEKSISVLNIAGARESNSPKIHALSLAFFKNLLPKLAYPPRSKL